MKRKELTKTFRMISNWQNLVSWLYTSISALWGLMSYLPPTWVVHTTLYLINKQGKHLITNYNMDCILQYRPTRWIVWALAYGPYWVRIFVQVTIIYRRRCIGRVWDGHLDQSEAYYITRTHMANPFTPITISPFPIWPCLNIRMAIHNEKAFFQNNHGDDALNPLTAGAAYIRVFIFY